MTRGQRFLDEIHSRVLVGDGATGTALFARGATPDQGIERLNLLAPDLVLALHRDYIAAGSRVIETNTFGANRLQLARYGAEGDVREVVLAGVRLARQAAGNDVYVAGSVGPLPSRDGEPPTRDEQDAAFREQVGALLEGDVDVLLFETFTVLSDLLAVVTIARTLSDVPIIAQMAFEETGLAPDGSPAAEVAARCLAAGATIIGANCGGGVPSVVKAITVMAPLGAPLSAFINAGFPVHAEGRLFYPATPEYLADRARDLVGLGVRLIGGCCGTDPATIRAIAAAVAEPVSPSSVILHPSSFPPPPLPSSFILHPSSLPPSPSSFILQPSSFPVLVELDPPTGIDVAPLLDAARALKDAGATAITVADNPLASARLDAVSLAGMIQREVGLPTVPHMTGRDRNRLALQSTILAAHALGIRALLAITGDPVRLSNEPDTKGVFDVSSISLTRLIAEFNSGLRLPEGQRTTFTIGVAVNPNVANLPVEVARLVRKVEAGAQFALTQPLFEVARLEALLDTLAAAGVDIPIFVGILPLLSARNAEFLHNEVPGIAVPDAVRARLSRYSSPADQRLAAADIAEELATAFAPLTHGLYLIPPRNRVETVVPLLKVAARARENQKKRG